MSLVRRAAKRKSDAICAIDWCVALPVAGKSHCAVHQRNPKVHPVALSADVPLVSRECDTCRGSGNCEDCDGEGVHDCEHGNCYDTHNCGTCDGTGDCQDCDSNVGESDSDFDTRYLRFVLDTGLKPLPALEWPWDGVSAWA